MLESKHNITMLTTITLLTHLLNQRCRVRSDHLEKKIMPMSNDSKCCKIKNKDIMMLVSGKWKWKFSKKNVFHSKDVAAYKQCFSGFVGSIESIFTTISSNNSLTLLLLVVPLCSTDSLLCLIFLWKERYYWQSQAKPEGSFPNQKNLQNYKCKDQLASIWAALFLFCLSDNPAEWTISNLLS